MKHRFLDPNIPRKSSELAQHLNRTDEKAVAHRIDGLEKHLENTDPNLMYGQEGYPPLFSLIEFNLSGLCNRKCVFCPRANPEIYPNVNEHIPVELYESIMEDLAKVNYDGTILFSAFGEPLLYKQIETILEISKAHCPRVRNEAVTDGDFVTPAKLTALFEAGLDTLLISLYDGPHQRDIFQSMIDEVGLSNDQVILRDRWLPPSEHYGITLSNRAGFVNLPEIGVGTIKEPMKRACYYPFYQILIDYDGAVLLCPHDWGKKLIVGNVNKASILDIWNNKTMQGVRATLSNKSRNFAPCNACDVDGTIMGQSHFDKWNDYSRQSIS